MRSNLFLIISSVKKWAEASIRGIIRGIIQILCKCVNMWRLKLCSCLRYIWKYIWLWIYDWWPAEQYVLIVGELGFSQMMWTTCTGWRCCISHCTLDGVDIQFHKMAPLPALVQHGKDKKVTAISVLEIIHLSEKVTVLSCAIPANAYIHAFRYKLI